MRAFGAVVPGLAVALLTATPAPPSHSSKLHLEEVGSDSTAFHVTSTLIVGPTEVLVWDAQYHLDDARRLADRIAATGKHVKAIVLSHPDHDLLGVCPRVGKDVLPVGLAVLA